MHKVENILLPDHIKIFCFGHQEKQEWWVIKTYHFCKHCNSLSPLGIFCLVYPFFIPYFDVLMLWACVGWCCAHSNTCGVLEQTFKYVSFTKIQNKGLLHVANKWPKGFCIQSRTSIFLSTLQCESYLHAGRICKAFKIAFHILERVCSGNSCVHQIVMLINLEEFSPAAK